MADSALGDSVYSLMTEPRQVTAVMQFRGEPEQEARAAEAWAFDLTYYFTRGVGEAPSVSYENGIYTVTGLIQTTHPGDPDTCDRWCGETKPTIDFILSPERQASLRDLYSRRGIYFDGRDRG